MDLLGAAGVLLAVAAIAAATARRDRTKARLCALQGLALALAATATAWRLGALPWMPYAAWVLVTRALLLRESAAILPRGPFARERRGRAWAAGLALGGALCGLLAGATGLPQGGTQFSVSTAISAMLVGLGVAVSEGPRDLTGIATCQHAASYLLLAALPEPTLLVPLWLGLDATLALRLWARRAPFEVAR